jgi:hypothetical protein
MLESKFKSEYIYLREKMPYLVSSILTVITATIILLTRYEADDSVIRAELDRMKSMFSMVDGFVNTYVESGGDLTIVNFEELYDNGILSGNIKMTKPTAAADDNVKETALNSKLTFPSSSVIWQLIPIPSTDAVYGTSSGTAYKLLVDMRENSGLMSKAIFAESFSGQEFCEKMLFGTLDRNGNALVEASSNFGTGGTNNDGLFVCIVFK